MQDNILGLIDISKSFFPNGEERIIVKDANLSVSSGEVIAFIGKSGIGKSTILQICGLLDKPSSGEVFICGKRSDNEKTATRIRREEIGFVYQFHHLLLEFNVVENIMIPLILNGKTRKEAKQKSFDLLEKMSLDKFADASISELSGGEKQRIAIARSLIHNPKIIIADEPTGNLDPENAEKIFSLLVEFARLNNSSLIVATHNMKLAEKADYIITIDERKIITI